LQVILRVAETDILDHSSDQLEVMGQLAALYIAAN
jgi:hypothetical protein